MNFLDDNGGEGLLNLKPLDVKEGIKLAEEVIKKVKSGKFVEREKPVTFDQVSKPSAPVKTPSDIVLQKRVDARRTKIAAIRKMRDALNSFDDEALETLPDNRVGDIFKESQKMQSELSAFLTMSELDSLDKSSEGRHILDYQRPTVDQDEEFVDREAIVKAKQLLQSERDSIRQAGISPMDKPNNTNREHMHRGVLLDDLLKENRVHSFQSQDSPLNYFNHAIRQNAVQLEYGDSGDVSFGL